MALISENSAIVSKEIDGGLTSLNTFEKIFNTNGTTTVTSATAYIASIAFTVTTAGTGTTITVKDKQATAVILVNALATTATNTTPTIVVFNDPVKMTSGIDITAAGTLAATTNVWVTYWQ